MYTLNHRIVFDNRYTLKALDSVEIIGSVENLVDTASIVLPSAVLNHKIQLTDTLRAGMPVKIDLGYNGKLQTEFSGYIKEIKQDNEKLSIECEDAAYLLRQTTLPNMEYKDPTLNDLLQDMLKQLKESQGLALTLKCSYELGYSKFVVQDCTAFDLLKKLQDDTHANIYIVDGTLYIEPPYFPNTYAATIAYDFAKNVAKDGMKLTYHSIDDKKLLVEAKGNDRSGKAICVQVGKAGGDKETINFGGISTEAGLLKMAQAAYERKHYEGYEGSFESWLLPRAFAGDYAKLTDSTDKVHSGTYYIKKVTVSFSSDGGKRTIEIGKKI